ncbi:hypothetical protein PHACT_08265 [Pseudohongiella acticola]|uniref:ABC-2 type transporter transmembrane domain-containing protein n=1 Tax=Pseudohongiella acticola TaxID=1524254 RepID=A0A1E8CL53_9GAMM|nr:ABC transporter permease [Pseudohongiella acticola]OFE13133.1 hypothetical protein PHACT_08265 [Pseudohongiella acticola]
MISPVIAQLIKKDLSLHLRFVPVVVVAGVISLAAAAIDGIISSVMYITTLVAFGLLIGMYNVAQERDKQIHLFMLSLPVTALQYTLSKTLSSLLCFLLPWTILTAMTVVAILAIDAVPDGLLPFTLLMQLYFVANFCVFLAVVLTTSSEKVVISTIIITNMSITLIINLLSRLPAIAQTMETDVILWSPAIVAILLAELALCVVPLLLAVAMQNKKLDVY